MGTIEEWSPITNTVIPVNLPGPVGVSQLAVDGSGNLFMFASVEGIGEWSAATGALNLVLSNPNYTGMTVDSVGNIYFGTNPLSTSIGELPRAYLGPAQAAVGPTDGSGVLAALPASESLSGVLAATSNQSWLTLSVAGGEVDYTYTANPTSVSRTAQITLLGRQFQITQAALSATITPPSSPQNTGIDSIAIVFNEPVSGFALSNLELSMNGGPNLLTDAQALTTGDSTTWTLSNLASLTAASGNYQLTLSPTGITAMSGATLAAGVMASFTVDLWQNVPNTLDVDDNGILTPIDALIIINDLNLHGDQQIAGRRRRTSTWMSMATARSAPWMPWPRSII